MVIQRQPITGISDPLHDCSEYHRDRLPSLSSFINGERNPNFIVPIDSLIPIPFEILVSNDAFKADIEAQVEGSGKTAVQFRAWAQTVASWRDLYEFGGRTWTAYSIEGRWKSIRALDQSLQEARNATEHRKDLLSGNQDAIQRLEEVRLAEARLASLYRMMNMSDVGTFEYAPTGALRRANEAWYRLSGYPQPSEMRKDFSFVDLVHPADVDNVLLQWNKLTQGTPVTFEMRWKGPTYQESQPRGDDEDAQWVLSACIPILDAEGVLMSIAGNTIDINAQKRVHKQALQRAEALEQARASERKFLQFAVLAPIAIYALDSNGEMTYCNNNFFSLTGHEPVEDYRSVDWETTFVFPEDRGIVAGARRTLLYDKQPSTVQMRLNRSWDPGDGVFRQAWVENQAAPELDESGNLISIFGTLSDISKFKWAEEIQRTRMEEAIDAKMKQENFIDMTCHEMRNPLSAVVQCADSIFESVNTISTAIAQASGLDSDTRKYLDDELKLSLDSLGTIISCSLHQKRVVDDILTLSKMDSKLMTITPVRTEPATIASDAVHMFQVECQRDGINLTFIQDPSLKALNAESVMMDPSRALQVLINLITNAIKFTRGCPRREIEIRVGASKRRPQQGCAGLTFATVTSQASPLSKSPGWDEGTNVYVWVTCQDTGCGLSVNEQGALFTRFTQASPRTHIRYGGSGLGLFISKRLVELQGGEIGVSSEPGKGSKFGFFVASRLAPPLTPQAPDDSKTLSPRLARSKAVDFNAQGKLGYSVLVVEDNLVNQKVLSQQLRKAGCTVHVANHGQEALDFLRRTGFWASNSEESPDQPDNTPVSPIDLHVVLMDVEMPVMDGLTCSRRIRQLEKSGDILGHVPIIAVSANARSEQMAQAREAGIDDAIAKPFRIPELVLKIEALITSVLDGTSMQA